MRDDFFTLKQFKVRHRDAAMKVGTDAVLLGAWAFEGVHPKRILDVGTGCGLMALMLAQRFAEAQVSGIELEEKAMKESQFNFEQSPFGERMHMHCGDFLQWESPQTFDAIICNPPYFQDKLSSSVPERNMARQERFLPPSAFWKKVKSRMSSNGLRVAVVLPIDRMGAWEAMAIDEGFCLVRKCWIKGNAGSDVSRVLLEWSSIPFSTLEEMEVVIEDSRGVLNASYQKWTHPFLLEK
jgi:tRNA1Val (adenine37-N6)-methyltransferase